MSHRSVFVTLGVALVLLSAAALALLLLVRHELDWYVHAAIPAGPERTRNSEKFMTEFIDLMSPPPETEPTWYAQFTDEQINSFFEEGLVQTGLDTRLLPENVSQPRIAIEPGRLRLAFRYGRGAWSTVISIDLGIWLAAHDPNVLVLELEGFRAGALPISVQSILEQISNIARQNNIEVSWYRNPETGHPCAVLRFQADQQHPTVLLEAVNLEKGRMTIHCRYSDAPRQRAMLPLPGFALRTAAAN